MKLSISYRHVDGHRDAEAETSRFAKKLGKLLKTYEPDLVQLHGVFSKNSHDDEYSFSLDFRCRRAPCTLQAAVKMRAQPASRPSPNWKRS